MENAMNALAIRPTPDGRLSRTEAAIFLGLSARTLANWQLKGFGPPSIRVGGRRFYRLADLKSFIGD